MSWNEEIQATLPEKTMIQYKPTRIIKAIIGDYSKEVATNTNFILKSLGIETEFVSNGTELLNKVSNNPNDYDVVITNNMYHKEMGEQVLYWIREKKIKIPIVVATGTINSKTEFLKKGFDGYLEKPLNIVATKKEIISIVKDLDFIKQKNKF